MDNLILKFVGIVILLVFHSCQSEISEKQFLIDNVDKMEKVSENTFVIKNLQGYFQGYYTEKSISFQSNSSFTIICWGNRNSFLWDFRKDKMITVSIDHAKHQGKNVDLDIRLIQTLRKK